MRFIDIIYLDPSLVSELYIEVVGVSPVTRIAKAHDLEGSVGAGLFRLGGTMRESREFAVSTTQMYLEIEKKLCEFPSLKAPEAFSHRSLFWTDGILGVGRQSLRKNDIIQRELGLFTIANSNGDHSKYLDLATKDEYFTSGYDRMAAEKEILGNQIWEPVKALLRPAFSNSVNEFYMFTPIVILKNKAA